MTAFHNETESSAYRCSRLVERVRAPGEFSRDLREGSLVFARRPPRPPHP